MPPAPVRRTFGRAAIGAAVLAVALPGFGAAHKIDVGGFRLNLRCEGEGSPVVVFDSGAGDTLATWDWVVPGLKKLTRTCAYDRAGLGKSDRGPAPRTSERIVAELGHLLARAGVRPPYVLVGHSFGGLNVRLYAARHPDQVAGLVLVDGTPEDFPGIEDSLRTPGEREKLRTSRSLAPLAFTEEIESMAASAASVREATLPASLPVTILTASHRGDSPEFRSAWATLQRRMAASFPNGRQVLAERSDHYIQFDEPEKVIEAVREIVNTLRLRRDAPAAYGTTPAGAGMRSTLTIPAVSKSALNRGLTLNPRSSARFNDAFASARRPTIQ